MRKNQSDIDMNQTYNRIYGIDIDINQTFNGKSLTYNGRNESDNGKDETDTGILIADTKMNANEIGRNEPGSEKDDFYT